MKILLLSIIVFLNGVLFAQTELPFISTKNIDSFYIPKKIIGTYKMETAKGSAWMKVYNAIDMGSNGISKVNDIRWEAANENDAGVWVLMNYDLLSENGKNLTSKIAKPKGVIAWDIYGMSTEIEEMNKSMGLNMTMYNFVFTVDKYVGKIFVSGGGTTTIEEAYKLAKTGIEATIKASLKSKIIKIK